MTKYSALPVKDLHKIFSKEELTSLCEELELDSTGNTRDIIVRLYDDLSTNGIPDADECSELLEDFLFESKLVDEDGNPVEIEFKEVAVEAAVEERQAHGIIVIEEGDPDDAPKCYSFADRRDPACRRCKLLSLCEQKRISKRPKCYGQLFDIRSEECLACIEGNNCKIQFEQNKVSLELATRAKSK